jgi:phospholipase/lecithinase/hemolysin
MSINFQKIVFFGDSLTDDGNLPQPARPDDPYVGGRFTNGRVYAEVLSRELGVASDNVALGGAQASSSANSPLRAISLSAQVNAYLGPQLFPWLNQDVAPGTAASLFIGGNDILNARPDNSAEARTVANRIVSGISNAVTDLTQAGFQHLVLFTLPDVTEAPGAASLSATERVAADAAVAIANRGIKGIASRASSVVETTVVDVNRLENEIAADRETFGIAITEVPVYNKVGQRLIPTGVTTEVSANDVAFFDPLHPTKVVHAIIGVFAEATLKADSVILRGDANHTITGTNRADLILAGGGNDIVSGRGGTDVILAGTGDDQVDAGSSRDLVSGGGGADVIRGGSNYDVLAGNAGADQLFGGSASDILIGGAGGDQAFGDSGNDFFLFTNDGLGNGLDFIDGGSGRDTLRLSVSSSFYNSAEFQTELQEIRAALAATPGGPLTFDTLDLSVTSIERVEVQVGGKTVFAAGQGAVAQNPALRALLHDANVWGFV